MKRTALKRRTRLRPMSAKRRGQLRARASVRREVLERQGGICAFSGCREPATDVHEIKPRSRGGNWLSADEAAGFCNGHHMWIHGNPKEAARLGLLVSKKWSD